MPIDYSKWDALDLSDDEEEVENSKAAKKVDTKPAAAVKIEAPKEAQGSAWNASNYHFEEQSLDAWGRARLKALLKQKARLEIAHEGQTFPLAFEFAVDKLEGDVWSHIRKGKTSVGYNIELEMGVSGDVTAGSRKEAVLGSMTADLMVDDEPDYNLSLSKGIGLPFTKAIQSAITNEFVTRVNTFVLELKAKADAHKNKNDTAATSAPKAPTQTEDAKSHFGGRVQVGGHSPGGLRIS
eukprot:CAMPEP_0179437966 /NCGR_PEP_ID=MMETSP0799-20121207/21763_1 /TAXON_ID=46947 /ORGANISM="Geminigera cryophila, Strain CCMP2564" /LENGTH=238 /DNA_ID=CAMNT_0021219239 /DNA_START=12 /DNA_END=728 /DNA_ORIENTATION=+